MKVIVNADDFGLTEGVTYGIYDAIKEGIVTSTTMMVNMPGTSLAANLIKRDPTLNVGLHLNISIGRPLTRCKSLVDDEGFFIKPKILLSDESYAEDEIFKEFESQYEKFISLNNQKPTHIDSHLYVHQIFPKVKRQIIKLSEKYELPIREFANKFYSQVNFCGNFKVLQNNTVNDLKDKLMEIVKASSNDEYLEIMVHPGFVDYLLLRDSSYNLSRAYEHNVLCSEDIKKFFKENTELISFKELRKK